MENIVIIGSSGHAKVIVDIIEKERKYSIAGFVDSYRSAGEETSHYPVLGKPEDLPHLIIRHQIKGAVIAIGDNFARSQIASKILEICPDLCFVNTTHPTAILGKLSSIGAGTVIMAGAVVGTCSSIGRFCILNTNASLDHDCVMGDFSSLAPGATTGGNCHIGNYSAICIGAVLAHRVRICDHCVIGAGAVVVKSVDKFQVAYGIPAKRIRNRSIGEPYL